MITVKHKHGVELEYDETLQPGDLIKAYEKGYFEFVKFEHRKGTTPLAHFKKRYQQDGTAIKTQKMDMCDASYCRKAKDYIEQQILASQQEILALQQILNETNV